MRPIKACFLFLYCLAALTAVGTAFSHLWRTAKLHRTDMSRISSEPHRGPSSGSAEPAS